jgi:hypothetical protein
MMNWLILLIPALAGQVLASDPQVLLQIQGEHMIEVAVLIKPAAFSMGEVRALSQSFLKSHRQQKLVRFVIVTDRDDAFSRFRGLGATDQTFTEWRRMYLSYPMPVPDSAEAVRIDTRESLRVRFRDGRIVNRVLNTGNAFEMPFRDQLVRILDLSLYRDTCPDQGGATVHVFLQPTNTWQLATATEFTRFVSSKIRSRCFVLDFGERGWFPGLLDYPIYNRFLPYLKPPTLDEYRSHQRLSCNGLDGKCL